MYTTTPLVPTMATTDGPIVAHFTAELKHNCTSLQSDYTSLLPLIGTCGYEILKVMYFVDGHIKAVSGKAVCAQATNTDNGLRVIKDSRHKISHIQ